MMTKGITELTFKRKKKKTRNCRKVKIGYEFVFLKLLKTHNL